MFSKKEKEYKVDTHSSEIIFNKDVTNWSVSDVCFFLRFIRFSEDVVSSFKGNSVIGFHLLILNNDLLKDLKVRKLRDRLHMLAIIQKIKESGNTFNQHWPLVGAIQRDLETGTLTPTFSKTYHMMQEAEKFEFVKNKVLQKIGGEIPDGVTKKEFDNYCKNLMKKDLLIENYLNKNFNGIKRLLEDMPKQKEKFFESLYPNLEEETIDVEDVHTVGPDTIKVLENTEKIKKQYDISKKGIISVKLVITEMGRQDKAKMFRKIISPIMFGFKYQKEFGLFHSALIVGPWYLDWNNTSLTVPRKCYSKAALIAADLRGIKKGSVDEVVSKIADVVIEWNCTKIYDKHKANCQHFVDDVLSSLNISLNYNGSLGLFLKKLRITGHCDLEWKPSPYARTKFKFLKKSYKFMTHEDLDDVFLKIQEEDALWNEDSNLREDIYIVKSYDRAFWLRYFCAQKRGLDDGEYKPRDSCPFGNPSGSSMVPDWFT